MRNEIAAQVEHADNEYLDDIEGLRDEHIGKLIEAGELELEYECDCGHSWVYECAGNKIRCPVCGEISAPIIAYFDDEEIEIAEWDFTQTETLTLEENK